MVLFENSIIKLEYEPATDIMEARARENMQRINASLSLPFQLQNFSSRPAALAWLVGS